MIDPSSFLTFLAAAIPRFTVNPLNRRQRVCISHDAARPLMIVAGPGSGKTTVLVLRALRLVFVEQVLPEQIVLTTFTKKAAEEIRSRLIEWGLALVQYLRTNPPTGSGQPFQVWLNQIDVNRFVTGTLDSICEDVLGRLRHPGDAVPVVIEEFVANAALRFGGLYATGAHSSASLDAYLGLFTFDGGPPSNFAEKLSVSRTLVDRFVYDLVDLASYRGGATHTAARNAIVNAAEAYWAELVVANRLDFAQLENTFLNRLATGRLQRLTERVRAVLVDEFQDTNPLQEYIYFELLRRTGAFFTIVGDDDQSLYRFRGATIELFRDFVSRFRSALPGVQAPQIEYLVDNYRSTPEIVTFFNDFIDIDPAFSVARVQPLKPRIQARLTSNGVPVLGMFRPDINTLAGDVADFLIDVFRRGGRQIDIDGRTINIVADPNGGDFGDGVFLSHTVNEFARGLFGNPPRERMPRLLRQRLEASGIGVFNPRGRALRDVPVVQRLLGTILLCIDPPGPGAPDGIQLQALLARTPPALRAEATRHLRAWRQAAYTFVASNSAPNHPHTLADFVRSWQTRTPHGAAQWPDEWPLLELCFKLITWIPFLHDDPEGQVYLEAITRVIAQAATFSSYRSTLVFNRPGHADRSVQRAIVDILAPIAENEVELDEDIMPSIPRDRFSFMTIHQAKGLEYPLVIVDVSSDYRINNAAQRFRRFPESPSNVTTLEDDLAAHCAIGPLRQARDAIDRTFDDLVRLYYVAYSRPQSALMLIGLDPCLRYSTTIKHVATGWRRNSSWSWRLATQGARPPALADNIPLLCI